MGWKMIKERQKMDQMNKMKEWIRRKGMEKQPRYYLRKRTIGIVSCVVGCSFFMASTGIYAQTMEGETAVSTILSDQEPGLEIHYEIDGETEGVLDYARTDYLRSDGDKVILRVTKWAKGSTSWGYTDRGPYTGRYLLNFFDSDFYENIKSVSVNGQDFEKEAEGALWKVPVNTGTFSSGIIGAVTNHEIEIVLKGGKSLDDLGFGDKKLRFTTLWVRNDNLADIGGNDNGFILKNNPNVPQLPQNTAEGNEFYLGTGGNILETDGTQSKDGNFTRGPVAKTVIYDGKNRIINSVSSFKPNQNFLLSNSGWVLYINEVIPEELLPYIDTDRIYLGLSDARGNFLKDAPVKLTVNPDGNGHISTKDTDSLSIIDADWDKVTEVRKLQDSQIFYGALGQRRSFAIKYALRDQVTNEEFAQALNRYMESSGGEIDFESWLEADFVDHSDSSLGIRKPDGKKPNKRLQNSYSNGFLTVLDSDKDGLYDFVEDELGTDAYHADTDGDGVPDGREVTEDKTDPKNAGDYLVSKPETEVSSVRADQNAVIAGRLPKAVYKHPGHPERNLDVTDQNAGNAVVKAFKYINGGLGYDPDDPRAQAVIPFETIMTGEFSMEIPAGIFQDGDQILLVAFSPNGMHTAAAEHRISAGIAKVIFYPNGGNWEDGTAESRTENIAGGTITAPVSPERTGYVFAGWAASADALEADPHILEQLDGSREVFAVWAKELKVTIRLVQNAVEGMEVIPNQKLAEPNEAAAVIASEETNGLLADENGFLKGTPENLIWGDKDHADYEIQTVYIPVKVTFEDKGIKQEKQVMAAVNVERDTDRDGTPDRADEDDDGDGTADSEETAKGSDPKDAGSYPGTEIEKMDAEIYRPKIEREETEQGGEIDLSDNISNWEELPEGTLVEDVTEEEIDTDIPGKYTGKIKVIYPDGSSKNFRVEIRVKKKPGTASPSEPERPEQPDRPQKPDRPHKPDIASPSQPQKPDKPDIVSPSQPQKPHKPGKHGSGGFSHSSSTSASGRRSAGNDRIYSDPVPGLANGSRGGRWTLLDAGRHKWTYATSGNITPKNGWMFIENPYGKDMQGRFSWFKFNAEGIMEFGWIRSHNGKWYHTHDVSDGNLGVLEKGWYFEKMDGKWYYLDPETAVMRDGWVQVDGTYYYFTEVEDISEQTYFRKEDGYWYYENKKRPYGSMYRQEQTPDHYFVNKDGAWEQ